MGKHFTNERVDSRKHADGMMAEEMGLTIFSFAALK
jgi:hypothetical protein